MGVGRCLVWQQPLPEITQTRQEQAPWWDELARLRSETLHAIPDFALGVNGHAVHQSQSTAKHFALEALVEVSSKCKGEAHELLRTMADIYAIEHIRDNAEWYWSNGHMTPKRHDEMTEHLMTSYQRVVSVMPEIIGAYGIPDEVLASPMTQRHYAAALTP